LPDPSNARAVRAKILTAEVFAQQLFDALGDTADSYLEPESDLSPEEVEDWMQIFGMDEDEEN
jgi:hypothetical protein